MAKLTIKMPAKNNADEVFRFIKYTFYPKRIQTLIDTGKLTAEKKIMDTTAWATKMLGLKLGNPRVRPKTMMLQINYKHVDHLSVQRLKEPGIVVLTKHMGGIVIDGNHRLARLFMDGVHEMEVYVLTEAQLRKAKCMVG